jgi:hypothetical protein
MRLFVASCLLFNHFFLVSWDSQSDALIGNSPVVLFKFDVGHAAALRWNITLRPYWNNDVGVTNQISQTLMPSNGTVFKGFAPSVIDLTSTWVQSVDQTHLGYNSVGWLLSHLSTEAGSTVNASTFSNSSDGLSVKFNFDRGNTYLQVLWQYKQSLPLLIGAIFAYLGTTIAAFAISVKVVEYCRGKCIESHSSSSALPKQSSAVPLSALSSTSSSLGVVEL